MFNPKFIDVSRNFRGKTKWIGNNGIILEGNFGSQFQQLIYWKNNIPVFENQCIEFWLEYEKSDEVDIILEIIRLKKGTIEAVEKKYYFTEEEMKNLIYFENKGENCNIFVSIFARGSGYLKIISLHDRYSRKGEGFFLPGGIRKVTRQREEVFFYFEPGNLKPPLNIYFSGYKTRQGFEGYNLLKGLKSPFLLISESRLEGGAFYIGDEEYENIIVSTISDTLKSLNFNFKEVIFTGLSMGAYGALYYSCFFNPYAVVIGKPLINLGNIALNGRINRPNVFSTSLDILYKNCGNLDDESIMLLNNRFWSLFNNCEWNKTKFIIAYMIEDDYDSTAYHDLVSNIRDVEVKVFGKGLHGRHNDDTKGIVLWFYKQLEYINQVEFQNGGKWL